MFNHTIYKLRQLLFIPHPPSPNITTLPTKCITLLRSFVIVLYTLLRLTSIVELLFTIFTVIGKKSTYPKYLVQIFAFVATCQESFGKLFFLNDITLFIISSFIQLFLINYQPHLISIKCSTQNSLLSFLQFTKLKLRLSIIDKLLSTISTVNGQK